MATHEDEMQAELERLRAENEALKQSTRRTGSVSFKVSEKGAVSVYGLGRFPVTLYQEQWLKLLAMTAEIKQFIEYKSREVEGEGDLPVPSGTRSSAAESTPPRRRTCPPRR